ncbi:MAG: CoA transferase [Chloroflexi bacterium]|nr:CoA transferase [Chloroflexota bacterium]
MGSHRDVLEGVRVVDFCWAGVGPMTTRHLADFGAEVIKVESMTRVEVCRRAGPHRSAPPDQDSSTQFGNYNSNKLSVSINVKHPEGVELIKRLLRVADVVTDSFSGGVMERLGLGYPQLRQIKPDIIAASLSLMGQSGPHSEYRGHGHILQAMGGLNQLTGWPERQPFAPALAFTDYWVPQLWATAIVGALAHRQKTGQGQFLDCAGLEGAIHATGTAILEFTANGTVRARSGHRHPGYAPHGIYRCRGQDAWCAIAVASDEEWQSFCRALGNPPWTQDERFATCGGRAENAAELDSRITAWTQERSAPDAMRLLQQAGVAAGVAQTVRDLHDDPQLKHRGHFWEWPDPDFRKFTFEGPAFQLSKTPARLRRPSPKLGEHNSYVFLEVLGLADAEYADFIAQGVIN